MNTFGIISCSNGLNKNQESIIMQLEELLLSININIYKASTLFSVTGPYSGSGKERAAALIDLYKNEKISAICDVSGGDLANEILPFLDFDIIKNNPKPFIGYSDLSVILNSILSQTGQNSYLYQIKNLITAKSDDTFVNFKNTFLHGEYDLFTFSYKWIQGTSMSGILIGGNLRCTLKLAGTRFMPAFKNSILLIESLSGDISKISTYLTQYKLMGAFENINGIILGELTEIETTMNSSTIEDLIIKIVDNPNLPIVKTSEIGHSKNSKCAIIGRYIKLKDTVIEYI